MVENGFFFAACKNSERIQKENAKRENAAIRFSEICDKYNTDIYGLNARTMTKKEYEFILKFLVMEKLPIELYPNLQ